MKYLTILIIAAAALLPGCGFMRNARLCEGYVEEVVPDDPALNLVIWPFHVVGLTVCAVIDQTINTFEIFPSCATDACDYLLLRGNGNNIIFEHSIIVPKTAVTPVMFLLSYVIRWLFPVPLDERPFERKKLLYP